MLCKLITENLQKKNKGLPVALSHAKNEGIVRAVENSNSGYKRNP